MRFKFNKNKSQPEKITKYSIRKFHFGAASVAVASLLFFGNGSVQAADNVVSQATENQTVTGSGSNSSGGGGNSSGDRGSAGKSDASATTAAAQVTPTPTATTVAQPTTPAGTEKTTEAPRQRCHLQQVRLQTLEKMKRCHQMSNLLLQQQTKQIK